MFKLCLTTRGSRSRSVCCKVHSPRILRPNSLRVQVRRPGSGWRPCTSARLCWELPRSPGSYLNFPHLMPSSIRKMGTMAQNIWKMARVKIHDAPRKLPGPEGATPRFLFQRGRKVSVFQSRIERPDTHLGRRVPSLRLQPLLGRPMG